MIKDLGRDLKDEGGNHTWHCRKGPPWQRKQPIQRPGWNMFEGLVEHNGGVMANRGAKGKVLRRTVEVHGTWEITLGGGDFLRPERQMV